MKNLNNEKVEMEKIGKIQLIDIFLENSQIPPQFNIQKLRDEGRSGFINPEDIIPTDVEEVLDNEITDNIDMDEASESIELTDDKKEELKALLLSPEFQALPYLEKKEILEEFGWTEPDLLSGLQ